MKTITFYMGEDIETLPRERLIEIINDLGAQLESSRRSLTESARFSAEIMRLAVRRVS